MADTQIKILSQSIELGPFNVHKMGDIVIQQPNRESMDLTKQRLLKLRNLDEKLVENSSRDYSVYIRLLEVEPAFQSC